MLNEIFKTEKIEISSESRELANIKNEKDIAIVYICTGQYYVFWEEFYKSMEEKFIPSMRKGKKWYYCEVA